MFDKLKVLTETDAVTGYEESAHEVVRELIKDYCDEIRYDKNNSLIAVRKSGKEGAKKIMIEAHLDQIGFMVKSIEEGGFLTFTNVGGIDARVVPSSTVTICGKEKIFGVIGATPPHLKSSSGEAPKLDELVIDTGMDYEKLKKIVRIGDVVTVNTQAKKLLGDRISARALDDRAGVLALIQVLKALSGKDIDFDIYAVFASQEEVTSLGAKCAAFDIEPDFAVAVDVSHASTPDADIKGTTFGLGEGVIITKGGNICPTLFERATALCGLFGIKHQIEAEAGNTGTDAWEIQVRKGAIPTLLLSIPLRYMHTSVEVISMKDVDACAKLIEKLCIYGGGFDA